MVILNRYAMRSILEHLDYALADTIRADGGVLESNVTWRIRMARERLLEVAIGDVAVEQAPAPARANDTLAEAA